ncbi:MAG: hypothetical protein R3194_06095 [Limnobacter sp.]|nr:hypothetical protein [Limnobacter sp.]
MKKRRTMVEVFSLSFLDIIACAFGAVVMLILLAKGGDESYQNTAELQTSLQRGLAQAGLDNQDLKATLAEQQSESGAAAQSLASASAELEKLQSEVKSTEKIVALLESKIAAKQAQPEAPPQQAPATASGSRSQRDAEVGGVPVDSDYVVFIVDTSGSMKRIWPQVMNSLTEVLNNHPRVQGFQVMSDSGDYLLASTKGRWLSDTPSQRANVIARMPSWNGNSVSSPVDGIQEALRRYAKPGQSLALYVFGDDFSGRSFDRALQSINALNRRGGQTMARIHAIAFNAGYQQDRMKFSRLMREVAQRNDGTFLTVN